MRDLIVCGDRSWNLIYFDRGLDRFENCVFERSASKSTIDDEPGNAIGAFGPGREAR